MGFPVGYKSSFSINLILFSFLLVGIILCPIFYFLRLLGLPYFKGPSFESFHEYPTRVTDPILIRELLPAVRFGDIAVSDESTCAICLFDFKAREEIRSLRNCKHAFHRGCVDRWINLDQNSCPLCRAPLVTRHLQDELKLRI